MASKKFKLPTINTPPGFAVFAWLNEPDTKYNEAGEYKLTVSLEDTPAVRAMLERIESEARAAAPQMSPPVKLKRVLSSVPWKLPEDDDPTDPDFREELRDRIRITAKSKFKPGFVDSKVQTLPEDVWPARGDKVSLKAYIKPYDGLGGGISLRLKTVQLIEKNFRGGGVDAEGFEAYDEGYSASVEADDSEPEDY